MSQDNTEIFTKITPVERVRLFQDLAAVRGEIICKGDAEDVYRLNVEKALGKQELHCSVTFGMPSPVQEKEVLGNFFLGGERYFFKTPVRMDKSFVVLRMDVDLFHLQRRQNYRIKIPESYQAQLMIQELAKLAVKIPTQMYDISSGGCRIAMNGDKPLVEMGDPIKGQVIIGKREPIEIDGVVRHVRSEKSGTNIKQIFGVEFKSLSTLTEGKLFSITMDLHREFFSRLNT